MSKTFSLTDLHTMDERSTLFLAIKVEMMKRGHWKNRNRGSRPPKESQFSRVSMQTQKSQQSSDNPDDFSSGL